MRLEIKTTHDGSSTLFLPEMNEHYHSIFGAKQESQHVYIDKGLNYVLNDLWGGQKKLKLHILEFGFGTGLNALLAFNWAVQNNIEVFYETIEKFPIPNEIISQLTFHTNPEEQNSFIEMHRAEWNMPIHINDKFILLKHQADFFEVQLSGKQADCVFYDAFAPNKQAEVWDTSLFKMAFHASSNPSCLITYCARGHVKRSMKEAGYTVQKVDGPPGKREMLRAIKLS